MQIGKMKKNINVDRIIKSLDEINKVHPKENFLLSLENEVLSFKRANKTIKMNVVYGIAASLLLLLTINFKIVLDSNLGSTVEVVNAVDNDYTMIPTKILYYE